MTDTLKSLGRPPKYDKPKSERVFGRLTIDARQFFAELGGFDWLEAEARYEPSRLELLKESLPKRKRKKSSRSKLNGDSTPETVN